MTKSPTFAFIKARWHAEIVDQAFAGFTARIAEIAPQAHVESFDVPGAFEMPLLARKLAETGRFDGVVGAALVVDGGIYRHDFVAQAVVSGLMDVQLATGVPVFSVSLTPHHFQPSEEHASFFHAHFVKKGREAAEAAVFTTDLHRGLDTAPDGPGVAA
ncbi:6,7-dimethyl-8-ribityllumazine synthase [Chachezhania antarctica]|uniref:6,7-dimethyl-8-ribityllumazine synthase n=1 Tax=Chachezhania antarctica TaxID=2340860 RepID=UPI000EABCD40|nr:6,7-dimethyl-8-ribityllumazine synthase [Chachezhania antarctica]|tara:strand:- start:1418 stop:1894 length:477 start_codon:yes stop_codon:yes gene_type:complete